LIHVSYSLSFRGTQNYETAAYLSSYLEAQENDYVPWKVFFWHMNKIAQVLEHRVSFASLKVLFFFNLNLFSILLCICRFEELWYLFGELT
jgi:hypothetical protein